MCCNVLQHGSSLITPKAIGQCMLPKPICPRKSENWRCYSPCTFLLWHRSSKSHVKRMGFGNYKKFMWGKNVWNLSAMLGWPSSQVASILFLINLPLIKTVTPTPLNRTVRRIRLSYLNWSFRLLARLMCKKVRLRHLEWEFVLIN